MNTSKSAPANRPGLAAILLVAGVLALPALAAEEQPPPAGTAPAPKGAPAERLDQLVAPIALYPDPLLMQILMASTYPLEIVQAERWIKERPKLRGEELDKALEAQTWDASVESLTHFPDVLGRMSKNLDWTSELGDVFLAQQADVLDAIQRMRRKANQAGKLESTKQQQVVVEKEIIKIVPADPQIVYVPTYVPQAVYGPPAYPPPYPAMYAYPPGYVATTSLLSFGAGMAVGAAISGGCDWGSHQVNVYNNYGGGGGGGGGGNKNNNNVNIDNSKTFNQANVNKQKWEHNPEHRRGVSYQNQQVSQRYAGKGSQGQQTRDQARGYDRSANAAAQTRPATGAAAQTRPATNAGAQTRPATNAAAQTRPATGTATRPSSNDATARGAQGKQAPPTTRQSSRPATQQTASRGAGGGGRQDAFGGQGNGSAERSASARGASSRGSASSGSTRQSGGSGGRPSGGSQQRGGGGGSRGGGGGGRRR